MHSLKYVVCWVDVTRRTVTRHTCQHTAVRLPAAQHMSMQWHTSGMAAQDMIHAMHTPCCDGLDDSVLGGNSS